MSDDEYVPTVEEAWVDSENASVVDEEDRQMLRNDSDDEDGAALCNAPPHTITASPSAPRSFAPNTASAPPQPPKVAQPKKAPVPPSSSASFNSKSTPPRSTPPPSSAKALLRTKELAMLRDHVHKGLMENFWAPYSRTATSNERKDTEDQEIEAPDSVLLAQWATVPPASLAAAAAVADTSGTKPQLRLLADVARDTEVQRERARALRALSNRLHLELGYFEPHHLSSSSGVGQSSIERPSATTHTQHQRTNPLDYMGGEVRSDGDYHSRELEVEDVAGVSGSAEDKRNNDDTARRRVATQFDDWVRHVEATGKFPGGPAEALHLELVETEVRGGWEATERAQYALLFERPLRAAVAMFLAVRDSWHRAVMPPAIPEHVSVDSTELLRSEVEEATRAVDAAALELASLEAKLKQRHDEFQARLENARATEVLLSAEETKSVLEQIAALEELLYEEATAHEARRLADKVTERREALYQRKLLQNADAIAALRQQIDRWERVRESTGLAELTTSSPASKMRGASRPDLMAGSPPGGHPSPVKRETISLPTTPHSFRSSTIVAASTPGLSPHPRRPAPGSSVSSRGASFR